jgi:tRNA A-37 threonylcarbamoyl transferase component Bud32
VRTGLLPTPTVGLTTAADALRDEESERTRRFIRIGWLVAAFSIACTLRMPGNRDLASLLIGAIGVTTLASVAVERVLARTQQVRPWMMNTLALLCVGCGALAILYTGIFAGAPLMITLGIYFFCRTERRSAAIAVFAIASGAHAVIAILVISGTIEEPGFLPVRANVSLQALIAGHLCAQFGYIMAFWLARSTRAASLHALSELQKATRLAAARAAQLDELRDDLDRALKVGGRGRFTGTVVGSWELGNVLGRGGMGEVYEAQHVDDQRQAAVKLLRRELMLDKAHVDRFLREVRAASALESPNVVQVFDASKPDDIVAFLAMERLRGDTLGAVLRGGGMLDRAAVVELVKQLAGVLELARKAGMVHRDLKPHNVFKTDHGMWKLLDFGVAVLADTTGTLTGGGVIGTPGYMAPEQAKGEGVDHRADLYALGAIVYRCLTGRVPFAGNDLASVLYAMVHDAPIRPSALGSLPTDVDRVLAIALAKSRADRFQTAADLADALGQALQNRLVPSWRVAADALIRAKPWRELEVDPPRSAGT